MGNDLLFYIVFKPKPTFYPIEEIFRMDKREESEYKIRRWENRRLKTEHENPIWDEKHVERIYEFFLFDPFFFLFQP